MRARILLAASLLALAWGAVAAPASAAACTLVPEVGLVLCDTNGDGAPDHATFARSVALPEGQGAILLYGAAGGTAGFGGASTGAGGGIGGDVAGTSLGSGAATNCGESFQSGSCALGAAAAGRSVAAGAGHGTSPGAAARTTGETPLGVVAADAAAACEGLHETGCHRIAATSGAEAWGDSRRGDATYGPGPQPLLCAAATGAPILCLPLLG